MTDGLAQAIYGIPSGNSDELQLLARTEGITIQTATMWRSAAPLEVRTGNGKFNGETVGVFLTQSSDYVMAQARNTEQEPIYIYTRVPQRMMRDLRGNVKDLINGIPDVNYPISGELPPPVPPTLHAWSRAERRKALENLLRQFPETGLTGVLRLLNLAVSKERLLFQNHPGTTLERLEVVQGFMALLPDCLRADLTFSTQISDRVDPINGRIVFGQGPSSRRHIVDWEMREADPDVIPLSPYVEQLTAFWNNDIDNMIKLVDSISPLVDCQASDKDLTDNLNDLTTRFLFNLRVENDEVVTPDELKNALSAGGKLPKSWHQRYILLLLPHALETRDTEADSIIAHQMDADPELDAIISEKMDTMLTDTPDLVYVFMRQRLSESISPRWLERLHKAAVRSLAVALESEDTELILSWLRLVAREPNRFELNGILHDGIRSAVPFASQDDEFALALLVLTARFCADMVPELLSNDTFIDQLPEVGRLALRAHDRNALTELLSTSSSLYLVGMDYAAKAQAGAAFEGGAIERLWGLKNGEKKYNTASPYLPENILLFCAETAVEWLAPAVIESLLALVIPLKNDPILSSLTQHLGEHDVLARYLPNALIRAEIDINQALDIVSMMVSSNRLDSQGALTVYVSLLDQWEWSAETQPAMESAARLLAQNDSLSLPRPTLNKLLENAATLREETIARTATVAILKEIALIEDDEELVANLQQVFSLLAWSTGARNAALDWWRGFIQNQPTARLTRLNNLLEGVRVMEDALDTLRSAAAMRRLMGKQDVAALVDEINTAYNVLETLAEAFEPAEKGGSVSFDPQTVRAALTKITDELTPHQRQILSNSFKGLATLIARLGDNRTKAGLGRRSDSVDRQFMVGEQLPQGAVDAMKWIAGYFAGAQDNDDNT